MKFRRGSFSAIFAGAALFLSATFSLPPSYAETLLNPVGVSGNVLSSIVVENDIFNARMELNVNAADSTNADQLRAGGGLGHAGVHGRRMMNGSAPRGPIVGVCWIRSA